MSSDAFEKLSKMAQKSKEIKERMGPLLREDVNEFSRDTLREIIENLSNKVLRRRTGRLATSMRASVDQDDKSLTAKFGTNVPYAAIHEFGGVTSPHTIFPKKKKALAFFVGGDLVFSRMVKHPGSRIQERPYIRPAMESNKESLKSSLGSTINNLLTEIGNV